MRWTFWAVWFVVGRLVAFVAAWAIAGGMLWESGGRGIAFALLTGSFLGLVVGAIVGLVAALLWAAWRALRRLL